ncbi:MAG: FAD-binding oxidoreductase [Mycobacteriaceae bacterium]
MTTKTRSWWGWGWSEEALSDVECRRYGALLPHSPPDPLPLPRLPDVAPPRVAPPQSLAAVCSVSPFDRVSHAHGKAFRDVVRFLRADVATAPDLVAFPRDEAQIVDLLDWAGRTGVVVVPFGGGSSVVGGVEYRGDAPFLALDLSTMDRVLEVDSLNRAALIQAGIYGPALETALRRSGHTLRFFPQSFEFSTLGGWLATRAGGHYATLHTHIDDFVESLRVVTPAGTAESLRLPGSGAGPSPDRLFLGSEGTLGVITQAWMRLQDRPRFKASTSVRFADFTAAVAAVRDIAQSGLHPANCRLLDPGEAALSQADNQGRSVLILGFESAHFPVDAALELALGIARSHGGTDEPAAAGDAVESWRSAFIRMPYIRDAVARMSGITETFETACTWDRFEGLYRDVHTRLGAAIHEITGHDGLLNCRFTHVYPDGPAPYFTVIASGRRGSELAMWDDLKAVAMQIITDNGGTVTHHHGVGRDHRPGYDRQRPQLFADSLEAVKRTLDPAGILNPGVLIR